MLKIHNAYNVKKYIKYPKYSIHRNIKKYIYIQIGRLAMINFSYGIISYYFVQLVLFMKF